MEAIRLTGLANKQIQSPHKMLSSPRAKCAGLKGLRAESARAVTQTTKFGPKLALLVNLGQAMQAYSMPCCGSVGGCGARAVSRKTPIYFIKRL